MHANTRLLSRLRSQLCDPESPAACTRLARWSVTEPALSGVSSVAALLGACDDAGDPGRARAILACLLRLAGAEPYAARLVLGILAPGLAQVGRALVATWATEAEELDQALAASAWARIVALAGSEVYDPARAIVGGARDEVRGRLRTEARRSTLPTERLPTPVTPAPDEGVEVAQLFACAVRRGVVSLDAARLVVRTRALGEHPNEVARARNQRPATLRMQRRRAEAALRAIA